MQWVALDRISSGDVSRMENLWVDFGNYFHIIELHYFLIVSVSRFLIQLPEELSATERRVLSRKGIKVFLAVIPHVSWEFGSCGHAGLIDQDLRI